MRSPAKWIEVPDDEVELDAHRRAGPCSIGHTNCCENLTVRGVHIEGGMAEYVRIRAICCTKSRQHPVEPGADGRAAGAFLMHAVNQSQTKAGEHVVIFGAGQIGLLAAQYAQTLGAIAIVVDPVDERLALARSLGIAHTVNPVSSDAQKRSRRSPKDAWPKW